jgi:hypothetical protein
MCSQSAICLLSSCLGLGGRYAGRVLLTTFSSALGPVERVGLWPGGNFDIGEADEVEAETGEICEVVAEVGEEGEGAASWWTEYVDEEAGAELGGSSSRGWS